MSFPTFMSPRATALTANTEAIHSPPGGRSGDYFVNGLSWSWQVRDNWCWAAVGECLDSGRGQVGSRRQCEIATEYGQFTAYPRVSRALGRGDCCDENSNTDTYGYLDEIMNMLGLEADRFWSVGDPKVAHNWLEQELAAGRPVPVRIQWPSSPFSGHFIVVIGASWLAGDRVYHVFDPARQYAAVRNMRRETVRGFTERYSGSGRWSHTYPSL